MQNLSPFDRPLTIGELLDRTFRLYRKNFGLLLLTAATLMIPYGILSGLLTGQAMVGYFDFLENFSNQPFEPNSSPNEIFGPQFQSIWNFFGVMIIVSIIGVVVGGITNLALTRQEIGILNSEELSLGQALRAGASRLLAYIGMVIVQLFAYMGVVLGTLIVFGCATVALAMVFGGAIGAMGDPFASGLGSSGASDAAFAGIIIGVMCLYLFAILLMLLPVAYFVARWAAATPALIDQKLGPIEALGYSWRLTKGHVRRSFIFVVLLFVLAAILVSVPTGVISQVSALFMLGSNPALVQTIATILNSIFSIIWIPLYTTAYVLYYYDLRVRKESFDLSQRIDKLETDLEPYSPLS